MLGSELIRQVSLDLNDQEPRHEYARWTYEQLQTYMQEAMYYIAVSLKDLFTERVVVPLEAGDVWQEACECTKITQILGECTKDGRILKRLRRMSEDAAYTWSGQDLGCSATASLDGYMLSSAVDNSFKVLPSVSAADRKTHYVLVECYVEPDVSSEGYTPPGEAVIMAKQWMLYRAQNVDSENNAAIVQLAEQHKQEFHALLAAAAQRRMMEELKNRGDIRSVPNDSSQQSQG